MDKLYNKYLKQYTILEEGEYLCPKCKGIGGSIIKIIKKYNPSFTILRCSKCHGYGKLDWIEYLIEKKYESIILFLPSLCGINNLKQLR